MKQEKGIHQSGSQKVSVNGGIQNSGDLHIGPRIHVNDPPQRLSLDARRTRRQSLGIKRRQLLNVGGVLAFLGLLGTFASIYGISGLPSLSPWVFFLFLAGVAILLLETYFTTNVSAILPFFGKH